MNATTMLTLAAALALAAACDGNRERAENTRPAQAGAAGSSAPSQPQADTPTTPANLPPPQREAERRESTSPVQQQVDPKQGEQERDFRSPGEKTGPRGGAKDKD